MNYLPGINSRILSILLMLFVSGCALPVTRSLEYTTHRSGQDRLKAKLGMSQEEVLNVMDLPDKIQRTQEKEVWIYYLEGSRWIIPPYISVGRNNYKFIFINNRLEYILFETMDFI